MVEQRGCGIGRGHGLPPCGRCGRAEAPVSDCTVTTRPAG
ncbi:hypothetical protein SFR_5835 [Streptomyces sp. FR-008]|nr:hypothetical protein SFR_5835 [Streptomyces sp. FR-008]